MIQAEVNNDEEMYNNLVAERMHVEGLAMAASDVRPGEEDPTTSWRLTATRSQHHAIQSGGMRHGTWLQSVPVTFGS